MVNLLNQLKNNGLLWLYFGTLISSDNILTVEDCDRSIELLKQTKKAIPNSEISEEEKKELLQFCDNGIKICEADKNNFLKEKRNMNNIGTISMGVKAPLIKEGDDIVEIVTNSILDATRVNGEVGVYYDLDHNDIIGITESVVARSQGNYVTIDEIADEIKTKYGKYAIIDVIEPIYSRNRFAMILKGIARGAKKVRILMPLVDEVGNVLHNHPFTKMNYDEYYKEICENEDCEVEIYNDIDYLQNEENLNILFCYLHVSNEEALKTFNMNINGSVSHCYSLTDICSDKCEYGLLGSNKATEEKLKLFPRKKDLIINGKLNKGSDRIVEEIKEKILEKTGADVIVTVYGDGCYRDAIFGIWEFADPVSLVSYTDANIIESTPNETKIKYIIDNKFSNLNGAELEEAVKNELNENQKKDLKGNMISQGTTPRMYRDLIASLMDLTTGSGGKGTPLTLIKNYFNNYSN